MGWWGIGQEMTLWGWIGTTVGLLLAFALLVAGGVLLARGSRPARRATAREEQGAPPSRAQPGSSGTPPAL